MTKAAVLLALVALAAMVAVEGVRASFAERGFGLFAALSSDPVCGGKELSCSGCDTVIQCSQVGDVLVNLSNVTCSGSTPYCQAANGTCQAALPATGDCGKPKPVDDFACPSDGYWPNLADCTKYFFCTGGEAYALDCSAYPNTVYSQASTQCVPRGQASCFTLSCPSKGAFVAYTPDPSIYAACRGTTSSGAITAKCTDVGTAIDVTLKKCVPACVRAGRFATGTAGNSFNECVDLGSNKFSKPMPGLCPGNSTFSAAAQQCQG